MSQQPRLRTSCDSCHASKVRCHGGNPCAACQRSGKECAYSIPNRQGRPRGARNKKSLAGQITRQANETSNDLHSGPREISQCFLPTPDESMLEFEYAANEDVFSEAFDAFVSNGAGSLDWGIGDQLIDTFNEDTDAIDGDQDVNSASSHGFYRTAASFPAAMELAVSAVSSSSVAPTAQMRLLESAQQPNGRTSLLSDSVPSRVPSDGDEMRTADTGCQCLLRYAGLITRLKGSTAESTDQQMDKVLLTLRHAQESWASKCDHCSRNSDVDTLTALVLSVRYALRTLGKLGGAKTSARPLSGGTLAMSGKPGSEPKRSLLGIYEMSKEEHEKVRNVLVKGSLNRIGELLEDVARQASDLEALLNESPSCWEKPVEKGRDISTLPLEYSHLKQLLEDTQSSLVTLYGQFQ